jgi:hypothetical protein
MGKHEISLRIYDEQSSSEVKYRLLGPFSTGANATDKDSKSVSP